MLSVSPASADTATSREAMTKVVDNATALQSTQLYIPQLTMPEVAVTNFTVTFRNFIGTQGMATINISTLSRFSPFIEIVNNGAMEFYTWETIELQANFKNIRCDGG